MKEWGGVEKSREKGGRRDRRGESWTEREKRLGGGGNGKLEEGG